MENVKKILRNKLEAGDVKGRNRRTGGRGMLSSARDRENQSVGPQEKPNDHMEYNKKEQKSRGKEQSREACIKEDGSSRLNRMIH